MCLLPENSIKTADEDIRVWKRVYAREDMSGWTGLFYNAKSFPFGEVCRERGGRRFSKGVVPKIVGAGFFHSFVERGDAEEVVQPGGPEDFPLPLLVECTIPSGAKYFTGAGVFGKREIASDRIIVHKPENL